MSILKEIFNEVSPTLEKYSPTIASILGGLSSVSHSVILPLLAEGFRSDPSNLLGLVSAIASDPAAQQKLETIEKNLVVHIVKIL